MASPPPRPQTSGVECHLPGHALAPPDPLCQGTWLLRVDAERLPVQALGGHQMGCAPSCLAPRGLATVGNWWKLWKPERGWVEGRTVDRLQTDTEVLVCLLAKPSEFWPASLFPGLFKRPDVPAMQEVWGEAESQCFVSCEILHRRECHTVGGGSSSIQVWHSILGSSKPCCCQPHIQRNLET